jgi:hypothetical protein
VESVVLLIYPKEEDYRDGLESWDWIDFDGKNPIVATAFGDFFFESCKGIFFLDKVSGSLERVCDNSEQLKSILNTKDGQDHYLMSELVLLARENGLILKENECYEFKVSPFLGGELNYENMDIMSFKVSLHITGQLIKQVKDLPPGTKIDSVVLKDS